ncbi:MAG: divalent-cation tolerance protein CutA [Marinicella pacifica]
MHSQYIQLQVTVNDRKLAEQLIRALLQKRLIACGQCLPKMNSYYQWQGKITCDEEYLLLLKTRRQHYQAAEQMIIKHHPYETPEIIATDIAAGHKAYLTWIQDET